MRSIVDAVEGFSGNFAHIEDTTLMNITERRFLEYVWHVLRQEHRGAGCCSDGTPRWPGYLGSDYRPGGMVFIGTVHNPKEILPSKSQHAAAKMSQLQDSLREWVALNVETALEDPTILRNLRESYLAAIPCWTGNAVWRMFNALRTIAGVGWTDVAFTNIAKCAGSTAYTLSCAKTFSLNDLR